MVLVASYGDRTEDPSLTLGMTSPLGRTATRQAFRGMAWHFLAMLRYNQVHRRKVHSLAVIRDDVQIHPAVGAGDGVK